VHGLVAGLNSAASRLFASRALSVRELNLPGRERRLGRDDPQVGRAGIALVALRPLWAWRAGVPLWALDALRSGWPRFFTFLLVTAFFFSCCVPTLLAGRATAA
jgi:hypothetical protein